jgi:hypothetical protein
MRLPSANLQKKVQREQKDWKRGLGAAGGWWLMVVDGGGAEGVDKRRGEDTTEHWRSEERQGGEGEGD